MIKIGIGLLHSVGSFHKNSGVDHHLFRCRADSQGDAKKKFSGEASSLASWSPTERSCSGSSLEKFKLMLMTSQQEARVRTMYVPFNSSKQKGFYSMQPNLVELFDTGHSCLVNQHECSSPLDDSWLLERCDGDSVLVNEVLQMFCAQGLIHIDAMHQSKMDGDIVATLFHVVRRDSSDLKHAVSTRDHDLIAICCVFSFPSCHICA